MFPLVPAAESVWHVPQLVVKSCWPDCVSGCCPPAFAAPP